MTLPPPTGQNRSGRRSENQLSESRVTAFYSVGMWGHGPPLPAGVGAETMKADPDYSFANRSPDAEALAADVLLVRQLQCGDAEAGRRFIRDYYPGIYRYLL